MTDHVFTGHYASVYQEGRDGTGRHLGEVEPFEIRDMDPGALPDHQWREATGEDRERWAAILAEREKPAEAEADGLRQHPGFGDVPMHGTEGTPDGTFFEIGGGEEPEPHDEAPPGPQPAAPAVIPGV